MNRDPAFEHNHDHSSCIEDALAQARKLCRERQVRLTPIRELVFKMIWQSHQPLGAYELLPALAEAGFNSAPPTVYRALDFLQEQGLIHRIASLNAFIGCCSPEHQHQGSFLICRECKLTHELADPSIHLAISQGAAAVGFKAEQETVEVLGLCPGCRENLS